MKGTLLVIGFIATILNFLGCLEPANNEMNKQLSKSVKVSKPIYEELTEQIIDNISDDSLLQVVFDNLSHRLPTDYKKEFKTVMGWNKPQQAIYMIWGLEAEVNNGGYNQFYFNSSGQFYKYLPSALKLVGAKKFADLTIHANNTFEKENQKITQFQDGTLKGFNKSYKDNPLNKFDNEFYDLYKIENLQLIQVNFIRKHKKEFVVNRT